MSLIVPAALPHLDGRALHVANDGDCGTAPMTGACCHENTGVCTDTVLQANCQGAGMRWGGGGSTCATLNPPCASAPVIVSGNPAHCTIDARIPFPANTPAQRRGFTSIDLTFDRPAGAAEDSPADYTVQQFPPGTGSVIQGVVIGGNMATITFTQPITRRWTCVLHNASNARRCVGYLPGDANGDRTAAPVDILDIIDNLNGVRNPSLPMHQCDIDRSNLCAPADILGEIDLLNGANGWPVYNAATLETCPSMMGP